MPRPKGLSKTGGRKQGTPNKVTHEFRETVRLLLEENSGNMSRWLRLVAAGDAKKKVKADPARALDLLAKLAEYASPKMSRTELVGNLNDIFIDALKRLHQIDRPAN